ncbi:MAG: hypothetical protein HY064_04085 [Bacteroidetes bacterium]|nr:hypothetical protein [Bacteroidota bacterium]
MKFLLSIYFFLAFFFSCKQDEEISGTGFKGFIVDSKIEYGDSSASIDRNEIIMLEKALVRDTALANSYFIACDINSHDSMMMSRNISNKEFVIRNLSKYLRRYMAYKNYRGEKIISIEAFMPMTGIGDDQVKNPHFTVDGGGANFWYAFYNVATDKISDWDVNADE